ncbi:MAG: helicase-associated domain-containing protein [Anaerolineae bacterium]|nr:helicase-associated domain-containing protein [Anaerolineae bacterium]
MTDARTLLESYHFGILRDMGLLLKIDPLSSKKADYVDALAPRLFTPEIIDKGLSRIGRRERETLAELQRIGGRALTSRFRLHLIREGIVEGGERRNERDPVPGHGLYAVEQHRTTFPAVIARLIATGLLCGEEITSSYFSNRLKIHYDNVRVLYIPDEVVERLPPPPPRRALAVQIEHEIRAVEGSARTFQRDLYFYWSAAHTAPLSLTKEGRLYRRDLRTVNEALTHADDIGARDEPDCPRLLFMRLLLTELGLLRVQEGAVRGVDHPPFLGLEPAQRIRDTFAQWRDGDFWSELLSIPRINVLGAGTRLDRVPQLIAHARATVLDHMATLARAGRAAGGDHSQERQWVPIDRLIDALRLTDYDFLFPRKFRPNASDYTTYYGYTSFRSPYISYGNEAGWSISPRFEDEAEGWEVVEAGFVRAVLLEPMLWMGMVDIGFAQDRPIAYRLTSAGEWALELGQAIAIPDQEGKVIVQPNFQVYALDPISDLTLAKLDEFGARESAERAISYRLSRESVYRAQRNGWTAAQIIETLAHMSDTPLPQNVVRTLEEWQQIHERIKIYRQGSILQAASGDLLDRLMEDPRISSRFCARPERTVGLITRRIGETDELVRNLQALGYPPARTRSADDQPPPSFTIDADGQIRFRNALPSIYLYEQIAPFTGKDERDRYYLTQSAVQEAIAGGVTVDEILRRLNALHIGPLPRWVEIKVRAWGKYYGDARIETLTLIQIQDEKTLRELMAEPEFEGLLRPFAPAKDLALAVVAASDLDALRQAFAERNIEAREELK